MRKDRQYPRVINVGLVETPFGNNPFGDPLMKLLTAMMICVLTFTMALRAEDKKPAEGDRPRHAEGDRPHRPDGPGDGEHRPGERIMGLLKDLNLTDDQKGKVHEIVAAFGEEMKKFHEEHKAELEPLFEKMKAAREAKDREAAMAVGKQIREIMEKGPNPRDLIEKISAVLTPEQAAKLKEKAAAMRPDGPREGGPRDGGPRGGEGDRPKHGPAEGKDK